MGALGRTPHTLHLLVFVIEILLLIAVRLTLLAGEMGVPAQTTIYISTLKALHRLRESSLFSSETSRA
jgi:hypothetical protein